MRAPSDLLADRCSAPGGPAGGARRGAWLVARLIAGAPADGEPTDGLPEPWCEGATVVRNANGTGRLPAFIAWAERRPDAEELKAAVFAVDPGAAPPVGAEAAGERFRLLTVAEVADRPDPEFLIDGHLVAGSLSALYGPPGSGKTLEMLEEAGSVASGGLWLGLERVKRGHVVIVAAEGTGGLGKRLRAWTRRHPGADLSRLHIIGEAVDMLNPEDVDAVLARLAELPEPPVLVYYDTFARCMTGDENSAKDVGTFIRAADRIRAVTGAHVRLIHHTGKAGDLERGSSALRAAADTMTKLAEDGDTLVLSCDKQRDAEPFRKLRLKLVSVPEEDSVVLGWVDRDNDGITSRTLEALEALGSNFTDEGATSTEWFKASRLPEQTYYRAKKLLIEGGYVEQQGRKHVLTSVGREALTDAESATTKATTGLPSSYHGSGPRSPQLLPTTTTTLKGGSGGSSGRGMATGSAAEPADISLGGEDGGGELPWP